MATPITLGIAIGLAISLARGLLRRRAGRVVRHEASFVLAPAFREDEGEAAALRCPR